MPSKNLLTRVNRRRYPEIVAETTATRFGDLTNRSAQPRRAAFLCVSPSRASFNGRAWAGRPSGLPVPSVAGSPTPPCARSPHLAMGSGLTANRRGRIMRHAQARPEQTSLPNSLTAIVADALRGAALAPTVGEALDVAGAALCSIAHIARADQPSARRQCANESFCLARDAADQTMRVLDRVSYLLEAIARLACDTDGAIEDLASVGRELVEAETDRIDRVFTRLAHQALTSEVQHG